MVKPVILKINKKNKEVLKVYFDMWEPKLGKRVWIMLTKTKKKYFDHIRDARAYAITTGYERIKVAVV